VQHAVATRRIHTTSDQVFATGTLLLAGLCLVLALAERYDAGAVVAAVCVLVGGWSMLISRTLTERFETVVGTVLGGTVLAVCLAYGSGLSV
jgi:uncharacterized membrane protein